MNNRQTGFTLIEMIIVLIVIVILTVLGTAGFSSFQVDARDTKRKNDVGAIARGLERRYEDGNIVASQTDGYTDPGKYPGINEIQHMKGATKLDFDPTVVNSGVGYLTTGLPGTTEKTFLNSAGQDAFVLSCSSTTCQSPGDQGQLESQLGTSANPQDRYVYEPVTAGGLYCINGDCSRFTLSYREEATGNIITVKSKHQ